MKLTPENKNLLNEYLKIQHGIDRVTEFLLKRTRKDDKIADLSWLLSAKGECVRIEEQFKAIEIDLTSMSYNQILALLKAI